MKNCAKRISIVIMLAFFVLLNMSFHVNANAVPNIVSVICDTEHCVKYDDNQYGVPITIVNMTTNTVVMDTKKSELSNDKKKLSIIIVSEDQSDLNIEPLQAKKCIVLIAEENLDVIQGCFRFKLADAPDDDTVQYYESLVDRQEIVVESDLSDADKEEITAIAEKNNTLELNENGKINVSDLLYPGTVKDDYETLDAGVQIYNRLNSIYGLNLSDIREMLTPSIRDCEIDMYTADENEVYWVLGVIGSETEEYCKAGKEFADKYITDRKTTEEQLSALVGAATGNSSNYRTQQMYYHLGRDLQMYDDIVNENMIQKILKKLVVYKTYIMVVFAVIVSVAVALVLFLKKKKKTVHQDNSEVDIETEDEYNNEEDDSYDDDSMIDEFLDDDEDME